MNTPSQTNKNFDSRRGLAALAICLGLAPSEAFSTTWSATASGTYNWNDNANWGGSAYPNATGDVASISADFDGAMTINLNEAITIGSLTINDTGTVTDSAVTIQAGTAGSLTFASGATITSTASSSLTNTISAPIAFLGDATIYTNTGASNGPNTRLALSGGISGSGALTVRGAISNNTSSLLVLSGSNTGFTGSWILTGTAQFNTSYGLSGPGLSIASDLSLGAVPTSATNQITFSSNSTAQLQLAAGITLDANRGIYLNTGSNAYLNVSSTGSSEIAGSISGDGRISVNNGSSARITVLSGNNTYTGSTSVLSGTLRARSTTAFGSNSAVSVSNSSSAALSLNNFSNTIGSLSGGGSSGGNVSLGTATLTTGGNNADTTYAGVISGTGGSLTKTGTGVFTLTGTNTYTGTTTINGGSLIVNGSLASGSAVSVNDTGTLAGSGAVNGTVTVNSGGMLAGTGTIGGAATINAGGKISAGASTAATLTFNGALNISGAANDTGAFVFDLGTAFDKIVAGSLTIGTDLLGSSDFSFNLGAGFAADQSYTLFQTSGISGTFSSIFMADMGGSGVNGTISISGDDIVLTTVSSVIPEPSSFAMLGGLSAIGFAFSRRRGSRGA